MKAEVPKINWLKGQYENRITLDTKLSNKKGLNFLDLKIKITLKGKAPIWRYSS